MKKKYIAGNWKMNLKRAEAVELAKSIKTALKDGKNKYMLAPSFTLIQDVAEVLKGSNILLGAQNMCAEETGAFTGEVSPLQLRDLGVQVVILGHSERRHIFKESNELINTKVNLALKHGFEVILCVGELLEEREAGKAEAVCEEQIRRGLAAVSSKDMERLTIAYEPVWAIGTGKTATPEDADEIHASIRLVLKELYGEEIAQNTCIQYGGSMKPANAADLLAKENIDGGLIGGASLNAETFAPIANF